MKEFVFAPPLSLDERVSKKQLSSVPVRTSAHPRRLVYTDAYTTSDSTFAAAAAAGMMGGGSSSSFVDPELPQHRFNNNMYTHHQPNVSASSVYSPSRSFNVSSVHGLYQYSSLHHQSPYGNHRTSSNYYSNNVTRFDPRERILDMAVSRCKKEWQSRWEKEDELEATATPAAAAAAFRAGDRSSKGTEATKRKGETAPKIRSFDDATKACYLRAAERLHSSSLLPEQQDELTHPHKDADGPPSPRHSHLFLDKYIGSGLYALLNAGTEAGSFNETDSVPFSLLVMDHTISEDIHADQQQRRSSTAAINTSTSSSNKKRGEEGRRKTSSRQQNRKWENSNSYSSDNEERMQSAAGPSSSGFKMRVISEVELIRTTMGESTEEHDVHHHHQQQQQQRSNLSSSRRPFSATVRRSTESSKNGEKDVTSGLPQRAPRPQSAKVSREHSNQGTAADAAVPMQQRPQRPLSATSAYSNVSSKSPGRRSVLSTHCQDPAAWIEAATARGNAFPIRRKKKEKKLFDKDIPEKTPFDFPTKKSTSCGCGGGFYLGLQAKFAKRKEAYL